MSILGGLEKDLNFSLKEEFKEGFIDEIRRFREVENDIFSIELILLRARIERI